MYINQVNYYKLFNTLINVILYKISTYTKKIYYNALNAFKLLILIINLLIIIIRINK